MKRVAIALAAATVIFGMTPFFPGASRADVPPPPANQLIGMTDVPIGALTEAFCRVCHDSGVPDRHHDLYGTAIPEGSVIPYPELDGDGIYTCISCHGTEFVPESNCTVCHTPPNTHHTNSYAQAGDCTSCHGDFVDNMDDGHAIPAYTPSLVTPAPSGGDGLPANSRGTLAGGCNYCHDHDGLMPRIIQSNADLHHGTGLGSADSSQCMWCHNLSLPPDEQIRTCEGCHGMDSLHNIQADSTVTPGLIVIGGEDAGYGHVGNESDCWGCHGFAKVARPSNYPDRHHNLYGETIASPTVAPYGTPGGNYGCLSCHDLSSPVERDCLVCHVTWDPAVADVWTFFGESVDSGALEGVGPGKSADNKLNAFNNMLMNISDLINDGNITEACQQLSAAMKKCDGRTPPPDFVAGDAADGLFGRLNILWLELGCTSP